MITIDWGLFILMLAGAVCLSMLMGLLLGCCIRPGAEKRDTDICRSCRHRNCVQCYYEGKGKGYERIRRYK